MNTCETIPIEEQIGRLSRQIDQLTQLVVSQREPDLKYTLTVEELAKRWSLCPEAVRRLVRRKQLKPMRDFRPFRFTMDEVRRYESLDCGVDKKALLKGGRR